MRFLLGWISATAQVDDIPKPYPVILANELEKYPQSVQLEFLEDASGQLTNESVHSNSPYGLVQAEL
jgi:hypothetical protein